MVGLAWRARRERGVRGHGSGSHEPCAHRPLRGRLRPEGHTSPRPAPQWHWVRFSLGWYLQAPTPSAGPRPHLHVGQQSKGRGQGGGHAQRAAAAAATTPAGSAAAATCRRAVEHAAGPRHVVCVVRLLGGHACGWVGGVPRPPCEACERTAAAPLHRLAYGVRHVGTALPGLTDCCAHAAALLAPSSLQLTRAHTDPPSRKIHTHNAHTQMHAAVPAHPLHPAPAAVAPQARCPAVAAARTAGVRR